VIRLPFELHIVANWNDRKFCLPSLKAKYSRTLLIRTLVIRIATKSSVPSLKAKYTRSSLIRMLVIRITNHPDQLGPSGKYFLTVIALYLFIA
jgi:hypothetical protein